MLKMKTKFDKIKELAHEIDHSDLIYCFKINPARK